MSSLTFFLSLSCMNKIINFSLFFKSYTNVWVVSLFPQKYSSRVTFQHWIYSRLALWIILLSCRWRRELVQRSQDHSVHDVWENNLFAVYLGNVIAQGHLRNFKHHAVTNQRHTRTNDWYCHLDMGSLQWFDLTIWRCKIHIINEVKHFWHFTSNSNVMCEKHFGSFRRAQHLNIVI